MSVPGRRLDHFDLGAGYSAQHLYDETPTDVDPDPEQHSVYGRGSVSLYGPGGTEAGYMGYLVTDHTNRNGYPDKGSKVIGGIDRMTREEHQRRGLQMRATDIVREAHGLPLQSRRDDLSREGEKFRSAYMKRRHLSGQQWEVGDW